jgi:hypothetical protein
VTAPYEDDGTHKPLVWVFEKHRTPGEICGTCSAPLVGWWVPAPFCELAKAQMTPPGEL